MIVSEMFFGHGTKSTLYLLHFGDVNKNDPQLCDFARFETRRTIALRNKWTLASPDGAHLP
jgi:hypothetical protein